MQEVCCCVHTGQWSYESLQFFLGSEVGVCGKPVLQFLGSEVGVGGKPVLQFLGSEVGVGGKRVLQFFG